MAAKSKPYALNKNKYLLDPEYERLVKILNSFLQKDRRNCVLLFLALHTGARATELLNLGWQDINEYDQSVLIRGLKSSNDRELPLPSWLFKELLQLPRHKPPFAISYNRLRQIWQLYRPVHKKFHCLRHTFAIRLYHKTQDIRLIQVALGHRNITNTMIYADYVYSQKELRRLLI